MVLWSTEGENLLPPSRKARAILAVLALSRAKPVLRRRVTKLLWSRREGDQARASLRQELHNLQSALAAANTKILLVTHEHLALAPDTVWTDVEDVMRATADQPDALSLFDGNLLECLDGTDPSFDNWLAVERQALRDRARSVASAAMYQQTEPYATIAAAKRLLRIDGAHEGGWRALMSAYAANGERGMAIQAYVQCRARLARDYDSFPSDETEQLMVTIRGDAPISRSAQSNNIAS